MHGVECVHPSYLEVMQGCLTVKWQLHNSQHVIILEKLTQHLNIHQSLSQTISLP